MHPLSGKKSDFSLDLEAAMPAYRHMVFVEQPGWPLPTENGMERDQFDLTDTIYTVVRTHEEGICGCARLLPTTQPYLLSEVFPALLAGHAAPQSEDVWELSRFASTPSVATLEAILTSQTHTLLAATIAAAAGQGARRLISVSSPGIERLPHRMGVNTRRAGKPTMVDGTPWFACWIEVDSQTMRALGITTTHEPTDSGGDRTASRICWHDARCTGIPGRNVRLQAMCIAAGNSAPFLCRRQYPCLWTLVSVMRDLVSIASFKRN